MSPASSHIWSPQAPRPPPPRDTVRAQVSSGLRGWSQEEWSPHFENLPDSRFAGSPMALISGDSPEPQGTGSLAAASLQTCPQGRRSVLGLQEARIY